MYVLTLVLLAKCLGRCTTTSLQWSENMTWVGNTLKFQHQNLNMYISAVDVFLYVLCVSLLGRNYIQYLEAILIALKCTENTVQPAGRFYISVVLHGFLAHLSQRLTVSL